MVLDNLILIVEVSLIQGTCFALQGSKVGFKIDVSDPMKLRQPMHTRLRTLPCTYSKNGIIVPVNESTMFVFLPYLL